MSQPVTTIPLSDAKRPFFLGVDVGGTAIKVGLVDDWGRMIAFESLATDEASGPGAAMQRVAAVLERFYQTLGVRPGDVAAIGLGAPGPMDIAAGTLVAPPQLPSWWNFNVRDRLSQCTGLPVAFINDANAAAFGEHWLGSGRSAKSMVLLTLGTGVGGGVISDGQLLCGANSFAGEVGHLIVDSAADARLCGWGGGRGQLEAYASAWAVANRTRQRLDEGIPSSLSRVKQGVTALHVYQAAVDNDALALDIIDEAARWLGVGTSALSE